MEEPAEYGSEENQPDFTPYNDPGYAEGSEVRLPPVFLQFSL